MNKVLIVTVREYLKNIRRKSFWIGSLVFPAIIVATGWISSYSANAAQEKMKADVESAKTIFVLDQAEVVNKKLLTEPFKNTQDFDNSLKEVQNNNADALIVIPQNVFETGRIKIYLQAKGVLAKERYNEVATTLVKNSILEQVGNMQKIQLFNRNIGVDITSYKNGNSFDENYEKLVIPFVGVIIYIIIMSFSSGYMLLSVSEEKENRMIEVVMTSVKSRILILGKIFGQLLTVMTQLATLIVLALAGLYYAKPQLPVDLGSVHVNPLIVLFSIFYILMGFLIMGNIMVAVGAAVPTYKEAQSFSSIFIILSILPIYFYSLIIADPSGTVAKVTSYVPFTAPMILLFRYGAGEISRMETLLSTLILIFYAIITFIIAVKVFEFGALEYNKRISLKGMVGNK